MYRRRRGGRFTLGILASAALAAATYGFTASNTVPDTNAGDGESVTSGYTVSGIDYTLNAADPGLIDSVAFTLTPDAPNSLPLPATTTVNYQGEDAGTWYPCTVSNAATGAVTCTTAGLTTAGTDQFRVSAAQ